MKRKGFSLVEVVISIALIVILIGMTYSAITISMTQTNTNELKRLALHEIENLRDVFRNKGDYLDEAVNLYLKETSELDSEFHGMFYGKAESIYSSSRPEYYVRSLVLYYNKSGGIVGFMSIAAKSNASDASDMQTLFAGQTEGEAFTITITVNENQNFTDSDAVFSFKSDIKGNKTVYPGTDSSEEIDTGKLKELANTEIESLKNSVFTTKGLNPLSKALNGWYHKKTSSDGAINLLYYMVEASAPFSTKEFCVTELTLYYDNSGTLIGFTTLAERRSDSTQQPENPETNRRGVNQPAGWAFAITITVDEGNYFIDTNVKFYFKAELAGGDTVYEDTTSSESGESTKPTESTTAPESTESSSNENGNKNG